MSQKHDNLLEKKFKVFATAGKVGDIWVNRSCRICAVWLRIARLFGLLNVLYDNELMFTNA